ncbi:hypothetical protein JKF63_05712 [Porcisia hertigi]|uniref:Dynein regulatory complex protein 12 n=1 Tax=Porcisia hertigi TaxID=2761500 RepID=A0A836L941_9TRYP|nr:hypothetical protein JKF63_05712 [Porcisia hertigi]
MPPKGKKASTAISNELYYEDQQLADDIAVLEERLKALKRVYLDRMKALAERKHQQLVFHAELESQKAVLEAKRTEKVDVLGDCIRAYKVSERKAVEEIARQDAVVSALQEEKRKLLEKLETTAVEFDSRIRGKKKEFESLQERIADMEKEFAVLLCDVDQCAQ